LLAAAFDFEWIVLAMAFIAFARWIIERVTGKKAPELEDDDDGSTIVENEDVRSRREEALRRQTQGGAPGDGLDPNAEIQKFFEALGGQVTKAPPPVERTAPEDGSQAPRRSNAQVPHMPKSAPPPLPAVPVAAAKRAAPVPSGTADAADAADAANAQVRLQEREAYDIGSKRPDRRVRVITPGLRGLLSSEDGLRSAILLHEILGSPRSLQSIEESHKF
jgi:hypothetical protein